MKRFMLLATMFTLLITLALPLNFALDKTKEAEALFKQAEKMGMAKRKQGVVLMNKAIALNPLKAEYYYLRGTYVTDNGLGIQDYDRAVVLNPDKYFNLCFGGDNKDASVYKGHYVEFQAKTTKWSIYQVDTVSKIKSYLATYKGNSISKVKNASAIMDAATDGNYVFAVARDPDESAWVRFTMIPDRKNEIISPESVTTEVYKSLRGASDITLTSDVQVGKLAGSDTAYFDYTQNIDGTSYIGRTYFIAWNYFAFNVTLLAPDQAHFDAALVDFINTMK